MDQKEKLTELSVKLKKLKENASIINEFEMAKKLEEIKLEMSQLEANNFASRLDNIENNMKGMADHILNKIIVANDSKIGTKAPGSISH